MIIVCKRHRSGEHCTIVYDTAKHSYVTAIILDLER